MPGDKPVDRSRHAAEAPLGDTDWRDPFAQASEMSREHRQSRKRVGSIGMNGCGRSATRTGLAAVFPGNREKYREKSGKEPLKSL